MSTGFSPGAKVVVEQVDDVNWKVREPFTYTGRREPFAVKAGSETDFASVPRVFVWFLPRYGRYTLAAILHDHLWRDRVASGQMDYIDADGTFRRAMRELGVPFLRRWMMWAAVRWAALSRPGGTKGWLREAGRVVLITLMAAPLLLPPAVVVAAALTGFYLVELALFVPLKVNQIARQRVAGGRPAKGVNPPTLDWLT